MRISTFAFGNLIWAFAGTVAWFTLCATGIVTAADLVNIDFQGDIPGVVPSALALDQQNGTTTIVTTTSAATDPFGVPGNQSMRLVDQNNGSVGYRAVIPFVADTSTESLTDLTIEMDMVLKAPAPDWSITYLWIGDTLGQTPLWFADGPAVQVFPAVNTNGTASVGQLGGYYSQSAAGGGGSVITPDVPFHLKIVTNSATSTYNVFVDGVKLGWDFGSGTVFDMPTEGTDTINQITFTSEGLGVPSSGEVFIDNFRVCQDCAVSPPGDYNGDGNVNADDYQEWKTNFGATVEEGTGADGNGNGVVDAADYALWRDHTTGGAGSGVLTSAAGTVPEPSTMASSIMAVLLAVCSPRSLSRRVVA